jgi:hypothetical protein
MIEDDRWQDAEFRKSSFSGGDNGSCVELAWRKSTFSGGQNSSCVEIARADLLFGVRDSKNVDGPVLALTATQGQSLLATARDDRFTSG